MEKRIIFVLVPLILALGFAGCDNPASIGDSNPVSIAAEIPAAVGNSETRAAVNVTVEANATLHCKGKTWPLVFPAREKERCTLQLEQISGTSTWKLLNDVVCELCGSNEWVSFSIRSGVPSNSIELHFQHPAKGEDIPDSPIITANRVSRK